MSSVLKNLNTRFVRRSSGWMTSLAPSMKILGKNNNNGTQPTWRLQVGAYFFNVRFNQDRQPVVSDHAEFTSNGTIQRRNDLIAALRRAGYQPVLATA